MILNVLQAEVSRATVGRGDDVARFISTDTQPLEYCNHPLFALVTMMHADAVISDLINQVCFIHELRWLIVAVWTERIRLALCLLCVAYARDD